jgi:flagellar motor protein MotB
MSQGGGASENVRRALTEVNHTQSDHDEESHPDERWLVSYADMMTLLFGLFVLLFSMATLKKDQAEAIRKSTEEQFANPKEDDQAKVDMIPELQKQLEDLRTATLVRDEEIQKLKVENQAALANIEKATRVEEENKRLELDLKRAKASLAAEQSKPVDNSAMKLVELEEQKKSLEKENQALKSNIKREIASVDKLDDLQKELSLAQSARQDLEEQKQKLEQELKKSASAGSMQQQSFIAFFINWSSKDHDIDMTIQDPNGKSFDFKKRKYPGQPGFFALDTRRGPGAELWQSDRLIPGVYKATYMFYNQYGNNQPATVSGTIFTPKGSTEVPAVEMTIDKKRRYQVSFEVDKEGNVKMIDSK